MVTNKRWSSSSSSSSSSSTSSTSSFSSSTSSSSSSRLRCQASFSLKRPGCMPFVKLALHYSRKWHMSNGGSSIGFSKQRHASRLVHVPMWRDVLFFCFAFQDLEPRGFFCAILQLGYLMNELPCCDVDQFKIKCALQAHYFISLQFKPRAKCHLWICVKFFPHWLTKGKANPINRRAAPPNGPRCECPHLFEIEADKNQKQNPHVQNLVTKTRPQTQTWQQIIANYIAKWQYPIFAKGCYLSSARPS